MILLLFHNFFGDNDPLLQSTYMINVCTYTKINQKKVIHEHCNWYTRWYAKHKQKGQQSQGTIIVFK